MLGASGLHDPRGRLGFGELGNTGLERGAAAGDTPQPNFSNVQFLAGWNGISGSTAYTEESQNAASAANFFSSAQLTDAEVRFGATALDLTSASAFVRFTDITAYEFLDNNFMIETWLRFTAIASSQGIMSQWAQTSGQANRVFAIGYRPGLGLGFQYRNSLGVQQFIERAFAAVVDTWYHIAVSRTDDVIRLFADGEQLGADFNMPAGDILNNSSQFLIFGAQGNNVGAELFMNGYQDESRITIGESVYTESFTPPSGEFPRS